MAKHISTNWRVVVNNKDLSDHAFDVQIADERAKIDVSGFNPNGTVEYLPGLRDQTVTVQMLNDYASTSVHETLEPLYTGGSAFSFWVQPDGGTSGTAGTLYYGGTASLYSFPASATLNQREEITLAFSPAPNSVFNWGTSQP